MQSLSFKVFSIERHGEDKFLNFRWPLIPYVGQSSDLYGHHVHVYQVHIVFTSTTNAGLWSPRLTTTNRGQQKKAPDHLGGILGFEQGKVSTRTDCVEGSTGEHYHFF